MAIGANGVFRKVVKLKLRMSDKSMELVELIEQ